MANGATLTTVETIEIPVVLHERTFEPGADGYMGYGPVGEGKVVYMFRTNGGRASDVVREITANGDGTFDWRNLRVDPHAPAQSEEPSTREPDGRDAAPVDGEGPRRMVEPTGSVARTGTGHKLTLAPTKPRQGELHFLLVPEPLNDYRLAQYVLNPEGLLARRALTVRLADLVDHRDPNVSQSSEGAATTGEGEPVKGPVPIQQAFLSGERYATGGGGTESYWGLILTDHWEFATTVHGGYAQTARTWRDASQLPGAGLKLFHAGMTELALQMYEAQEGGPMVTAESIAQARHHWKGWDLVRRHDGPEGPGLDTYLTAQRQMQDAKEGLGDLLYKHLLPDPSMRQAVVDRFSPYLPAPVRFDLSSESWGGAPEDYDRFEAHSETWAESAGDGDLTSIVGLMDSWSDWIEDAGLSTAGRNYVANEWGLPMDPGHYVLNGTLLVRRLLMAGAGTAGVASETQNERNVLADRRAALEAAEQRTSAAAGRRATVAIDNEAARREALRRLSALDERMTEVLRKHDEAVSLMYSARGQSGGYAKALYGTLRKIRVTVSARAAALGISESGPPGPTPVLDGVPRAPQGLSGKGQTLWDETYQMVRRLDLVFNEGDPAGASQTAREVERLFQEAGEKAEAMGQARGTAAGATQAEADLQTKTEALERSRRRVFDAERVLDTERRAGAPAAANEALADAQAAQQRAQDALDRARRDIRAATLEDAVPGARDSESTAARLARELRRQDVSTAEIGARVEGWERMAISFHLLSVGFSLKAVVDAIGASRATDQGANRFGLAALETVGLMSSGLDLAVGWRYLSTAKTSAAGVARVRMLGYARAAAFLEAVYFSGQATIALSEGDEGAAAGYTTMAVGSVFAGLAASFAWAATLGPIGLALVAVGILVVIFLSNSELESWLEQCTWGTESDPDWLDRALIRVGLRREFLTGLERLEQEVVALFHIVALPRITARLMTGDDLYEPTLDTTAPDLVVRVEPGFFDPGTMRLDVEIRIDGSAAWVTTAPASAKKISVLFPEETARFREADEDGRYGWTARWTASELFDGAPGFAARGLRARANARLYFTDVSVAARPGMEQLNGRLKTHRYTASAPVGHVDSYHSAKEGYTVRNVRYGVLKLDQESR